MKTPPTIPAPLPTDHRLLRLAGLLKVSRRDALGATVDAWAWIAAQATGGIVPQPVVLLDSVAEIEGYGEAAVAVGLVGTADGHIVAPAELRAADAQGTARRAGTADDDGRDRKRQQDRVRQRRRRNGSRLTGKAKTPTPTDAAVATSTTPSRAARRLGTVADGQHVMLLWSPKTQGWFYKVTGATPPLTGTVTDQENPTLADALKALLDARLTQAQREKGRLVQTVFSPSMEQLVAAARQEHDSRQAAVASAARLDEGNVALARAADDDADQGDREPEPVPPTADAPSEGVAERDCHAPVTPVTRDTVTCHAPVTLARDASTLPGNGLDAVFCHASVTLAAPSSSSSSLNDERNENKDTTTTSVTADHERDAHADQGDDFSRYLKAAGKPDELDRYLTASGCLPTLTPEQVALVQRIADALDTTPAAVREQGRNRPAWLAARCHAAGIDPKTGFPMAARAARAGDHAPTSPQDAPGRPSGTGTGVQSVSSGQASGGIVGAPATATSTGSPDDVDVARFRLSQGLTAVTDGLQADDHDDGRTDAEQQRRRDDAEQHRRRNEALRDIAAFHRDHGRDINGKPAERLTEPVG